MATGAATGAAGTNPFAALFGGAPAAGGDAQTGAGGAAAASRMCSVERLDFNFVVVVCVCCVVRAVSN